MLEQALEQHRQGNFAEAETLYQALVETEPENYEALHCYGLLKQDLGQLDEALDLVERALELRPEAAAYYATLGVIRHAQGDIPAALANLEQALTLNPNLVQGHNTLGYLQLQAGELDAAERSLQTALKLDPESDQAQTNLGNALLAQGRVDEALSHFQQALVRNPDSLAARASLAEALLRQGALAIAEEAFRTALEVRPQSAALRSGLARALLAQGRQGDALHEAENGLASDPQHFDCLLIAGQSALALEHAAQATEFAKRALLNRRGQPDAIELLAQALEMGGDLDAAKRSYEAIAAQRPAAEVRLLRLRARVGETEAATQGLQQLVEGDARRTDAALALADLLEEKGDPTAALAALKALAEDAPQAQRLALRRAELALAAGDAQASLDELEAMSTTELSDREAASARELRARALDAQGRFGDAARAFAEVVREMNPPQLKLRTPARQQQPAPKVDDGRSPPVLLTGLPGSGLRWLAKLLQSMPAFEVLTDRLVEAGERRDFLDSDADGRRGDRPPETHVQLERRAYWKGADRRRRKLTGRVLLVDVVPPQQFDAALVAHFFPGARLLVAHRHPGDLLLHARTFGWRQQLVRAEDIAGFHTRLRHLPEDLDARLDRRWIDTDALRAGKLEPLQQLVDEYSLTAQLQTALARAGESADPHYWPAGHWRHYHENLALLGPQLSALASDLGYKT